MATLDCKLKPAAAFQNVKWDCGWEGETRKGGERGTTVVAVCGAQFPLDMLFVGQFRILCFFMFFFQVAFHLWRTRCV